MDQFGENIVGYMPNRGTEAGGGNLRIIVVWGGAACYLSH